MILKNANHTIRIFEDHIREPFQTFTSRDIEFRNAVTITATQQNITFPYSSPIQLNVNGNSIIQTGNSIIIEEEGLERHDLYDSFDLSIEFFRKAKNILQDSNKRHAVIISNTNKIPICMYLGDYIDYQILTDMSKTTRFIIDGKDLYLHRVVYQTLSKSQLD